MKFDAIFLWEKGKMIEKEKLPSPKVLASAEENNNNVYVNTNLFMLFT